MDGRKEGGGRKDFMKRIESLVCLWDGMGWMGRLFLFLLCFAGEK